MAAPAGYDDPDDWELVNDDGFVHKRKKRPRFDPSATSSTAPPPPDPALERKRRREWKKESLLKLRDKYANELNQWELLSNTLNEMEQNTQSQSIKRYEIHSTTSFVEASSSQEHLASARRSVVDDLLSQVEAQEAIIRDASNLCDIAESVCSAEEDRVKQQLIDLPIWEPSPQELMAALGFEVAGLVMIDLCIPGNS